MGEAMAKAKQITTLRKGLDPAVVKQRPQGGRAVSYVTGGYIKGRLNEVFGFGGWDSEITELVAMDDPRGPWARATVRLTVRFEDGNHATRHDVGFGSASPKQHDGRELAGKEAATDALKRAAASLGNQFGLSLYDKDNPIHQGGADSHVPTAGKAEIAAFNAECESLSMEPHHVAQFLRAIGKPAPGDMSADQLGAALKWLASDKGSDRFNKWLSDREA